MNKNARLASAAGCVALAIGAALSLPGLGLVAADHLDPPGRTNPAVDATPDRAGDIADLYAWHTDTALNLILTFAGPQATDKTATYDPDVLYTINISNTSDRVTPDIPIRIRFGNNGVNQFGVQVSGVPGTTGPIVGSVESTIVQDGVTIRAGLFDDPFFFDSQGLTETRDTGTLSFNPNRDFFSGQNITAVVMSIPLDRIRNGTNLVDIWATTARFGGQL